MALRRRRQSPVRPAPPAPAQPAAEDTWHAEPGFAPVGLEEPPAEELGLWAAAADPIDVTDTTVDMPVLAVVPRRRAARAGRALLTLALVLGCAGVAVAASGVLKAQHEESPPAVATGSSSTVAPTRHHAKPAHHKRVTHRHHRRRHRAPHRRVAVAPRRLVAAVPVRSTPAAPAPVQHVVRQPVSRPAPKPAPTPVASKPTAAPQPAPSAPSGEPGRQPQPQP